MDKSAKSAGYLRHNEEVNLTLNHRSGGIILLTSRWRSGGVRIAGISGTVVHRACNSGKIQHTCCGQLYRPGRKRADDKERHQI